MPAEFNSNKMMNTQPTDSRAAFSSQDDSGDELIWELLSLYVDGEASAPEAAQVEQMLRHDAEYARAYAFMQTAGTTIRAIVEIEPPTHLREAILAKTSHRPTFSQRLGLAVLALRTQFAMPIGRMALAGGGLALVIGICAGRMSSIDLPRTTQVNASNTVPTNINVPSPNAPAVTAPVPAAIPSNTPKQAKADAGHKSGIGTENGMRGTIASTEATAAPKKSVSPVIAQSDVKIPVTPKVAASELKSKLSPVQHHLAPSYRQIATNTQNVNPMMDTAVYHIRANSDTARPVSDNDDDLNDEHLVPSHEDAPDGVVAKTETDVAPAAGHKVEGKLVLSKLPPSSRHILSPSEVIRQVNSTAAVNYNAVSSDDTQGRTAELRVLTSKF